EMAAKGGLGIEFDLDLVPARETGMVPYEYLLSESQERMLFVAHKGREQELIDIFHRWGLHAVVAGKVIEEPLVRILFQGEVAAEIPATALADNTPIYQRELLTEPPDYALQAWEWHGDSLPPCNVKGIDINGKHYSWNDILGQLLDTPTIASKRWVYRQYDHQVQNNTLILPGNADAAVIRLRPLQGLNVERLNVEELNVDRLKVVREAWPKGQGSTETNLKPANLKPANLKPANLQPETNLQPANLQPVTSSGGVAATVDCNSRYVYLDPYEGAKAVVAEAARNLSCVGAEPLAVTDNLNFGSPEKPVGYWQLASACAGIAEACREMSTPVTGGNVSLYNETIDSDGNPQSIYPTPVVGMVGLVADITKTCGQGWQAQGDLIYLLGLGTKYWNNSQSQIKSQITLGASEYLATIHGMVAGKPPVVDFDLERRVQTVTREGISQGWVNSAHDCAEGGLVVALAESCIAGKLGADITLGYSSESLDLRWDQVLFGEGGSRILVSVSPQQETSWESYLQQQLGDEGYWQQLGVVQGENAGLRVLVGNGQCVIEVTVQEMCDCWENGIERRLRV
ncbi:MAG: phosphoribosylformylglycinamidine synthase II, partial [Moorea sp. SIO4G2]|nr:phosphoribosylformylglycinamidine synthase II [Moorena sp. SIO4G2]